MIQNEKMQHQKNNKINFTNNKMNDIILYRKQDGYSWAGGDLLHVQNIHEIKALKRVKEAIYVEGSNKCGKKQ